MIEESQYALNYQQLLRDLKTTVEGLLVSQVANVWLIYGGLNRLHSSIEKVFKHGCRNTNENEPDYFNFIHGLEWLQPETSNFYFSIDCEYKPHLPQHLKDDKASTWLYRSLENHSLSQKLSWLLSDKNHLSECYYPHAFLCQEKYAEATLICLRAVERNQPSLMSEINPCLFVYKSNSKEFQKLHRRCSSYPDNHLRSVCDDMRKRSKTVQNFSDALSSCKEVETKSKAVVKTIQGKLRAWQSMPNLQVRNLKEERIVKKILQSRTTPSTPVHTKKIKISPSVLKVDYNDLQSQQCRNKKTSLKKGVSNRKPRSELRHVVINNSNIIEHTPPLSSSYSSGNMVGDDASTSCFPIKKLLPDKSPTNLAQSPISVVDYNFLPLPGEKDFKRKPKKSFIEDGGLSVLPMATGYFPKPEKGQSLLSFLTSSQFARANAELDRENAHFSISEAIISAMEQIRCQRDEKLADEQLDESDPEILDLKQRIRLRRRQKIFEKTKKNVAGSLLSDGKTDTTTTVSPCTTSSDSDSSLLSSDDVDDLEIDEASNLNDNPGLSMSMASLYSGADVFKRPRGAPDGASDILSAEGVALSLISKFSEKQLPRASDLVWLVSEEDAPQALLPLPKSWPVSPDDSKISSPLRGTQEWAPPRAQIIFTLHPAPSRKKLMEKQNYRCAGCSMRVAPQYASRFRYCHYLGRYFCTGCHTNQLSLIPARILQKWDFTRYQVSTFSYRLLEQMYTDPLFRIFEYNKNIGKRSKNLLICKKYRLGLFYLKDFIFSCRYAKEVQESLAKERSYTINDPDMYSIEDLVNIKNGEMKNRLEHLVDICCKHALECDLCLARGFICEICNAEGVIFPWQMSKVSRCDKCKTCYHISCWNKELQPCQKCTRITQRKESITLFPSSTSSEE